MYLGLKKVLFQTQKMSNKWNVTSCEKKGLGSLKIYKEFLIMKYSLQEWWDKKEEYREVALIFS